ncbi:hypothetical protein HUJ04_010157 [Dendroctonus ponderosae]|uniref:Sphingomyelin phosphodiesterase n=1 Tax=Dendroctonus ponderosae TaxID=77166 RepID=A0AAR5P906_DENPD|nr:hypothetical protein HUJ04_010157 [Dendroctonus ponderosae]
MKCSQCFVFILSIIILCFVLQVENKQIFKIITSGDTSVLIPPHLVELAGRLKYITPKKDADAGCKICENAVDGIIALRRSNATRDVMIDCLNHICVLFTSWGIKGCTGRVNIETDTILYIIDHRQDLTAARFCAIYFQNYGCEDPNADSWSIPLPPVPTTRTQRKHQTGTGNIQILQITDVHLDPLYSPGSNSKCSEPLCCESGTPANAEDAAGYWGDYAVCDMPWHTIDNMMDQIKKNHEDIDIIYFTGDIVSHRTYATTVQGNQETIKLLFELLERTFPDKTVYPILGNHEPHPGDFYSPHDVPTSSNVSTQWLLDLVADEWSRWLPNAAQTTIKQGGFYTVLVKPGFRIIALNSNVCFTSNLWLIYANIDTFGQLQWLVGVLTEAENNGEKVHILSHVPSGDDVSSCVKIWSREFKKIVLRFSNTITAQFNGHTHMDQFVLFLNESDEVQSVAYNGASFATFIGSNPNYRIYDLDNSNFTVTDYSEYTFNLTEANFNAESSPNWYKLYWFKNAYGLPDLTPKSLGNLYTQMASNNSDNALVDKYFRYVYRDSDVYIKEGCDQKCNKKLVCLLVASESSQSMVC